MNGGTSSPLVARTRLVRLGLAALVVLVAAWVALWREPTICREELVPASRTTVDVCGPPAVTDVAVGAALAVVLLLLAPDLGEAGVAGITLKRRVEEARADAAAARADVATLRLALTASHQVDVATTASATAVADGGAELVATLWSLGLIRSPSRPDTAPPVPPPYRASSPNDAGPSLLMSVAVDGIGVLLPEEWRDATFVGRSRDLTVVTGPELDPATRGELFGAGGLLGAASTGQVTVERPTPTVPAMAAAPVVTASGTHVGEVAVVLPPGADVDRVGAAEGLAPVQAAFAALVDYAAQHGLTHHRATSTPT